MSRPTSKTVQSKINTLWALMAQAAAKKAISQIQICSDANGAERWANHATDWLIKAGAASAHWDYEKPKVER